MGIIAELEEYVQYEGSEFGEYCEILMQLYCCSYTLEEEFEEYVNTELTKALDYFKEHAKLITTEETYTQSVTVLEWEFD